MASDDATDTRERCSAVGVWLLRCPPAHASQSSCIGRVGKVISTVGFEWYGKHTRQTKSFTESHAFFRRLSVAAPSPNKPGATSVDAPTCNHSRRAHYHFAAGLPAVRPSRNPTRATQPMCSRCAAYFRPPNALVRRSRARCMFPSAQLRA